ncbi:hypothetical protein EV356DRAFT_360290 [Viridothelium virens]|uniref:Uncharacterized protein n=1 Tax=Viridothelium virens TaxID=1048519 RepID=A0A6A6HI76_VIRVR|nr:hypothetical protein EV356DRAFT_360290 [Viridothelium virens]
MKHSASKILQGSFDRRILVGEAPISDSHNKDGWLVRVAVFSEASMMSSLCVFANDTNIQQRAWSKTFVTKVPKALLRLLVLTTINRATFGLALATADSH